MGKLGDASKIRGFWWNGGVFLVEKGSFSEKMVVFFEKWGFHEILVKKSGKSGEEPGI